MVNVLIKKASKCNARGRYEFGRLDKNLAMFYFSAAIGFLNKAEKEIENSVETTNWRRKAMTIEEIIISSIIMNVIIVLVVFLYPKDDDNKED